MTHVKTRCCLSEFAGDSLVANCLIPLAPIDPSLRDIALASPCTSNSFFFSFFEAPPLLCHAAQSWSPRHVLYVKWRFVSSLALNTSMSFLHLESMRCCLCTASTCKPSWSFYIIDIRVIPSSAGHTKAARGYILSIQFKRLSVVTYT